VPLSHIHNRHDSLDVPVPRALRQHPAAAAFHARAAEFPGGYGRYLEFAARDRHAHHDADCRFSHRQAMGYARAFDRRPRRLSDWILYVFLFEFERGAVGFLLAADGHGRGTVVYVRSSGDDHRRSDTAGGDGIRDQSDRARSKPWSWIRN